MFSMFRRKPQPGFIMMDFVRFFPHKFWISTWGSDSSYPDGFRYKLLTVRDEKEQCVEVVLLLEQRNGDKQEMTRSITDLESADGYAGVFWKGLEKEYGIEFEEQDFSAARSLATFDQAVAKYDWKGEPGSGAK